MPSGVPRTRCPYERDWVFAVARMAGNSYGMPRINLLLSIQLIRCVQPVFHFVVNFGHLRDGDAVRDAVFLGVAAGVDETARRFGVLEREAEVDARARRW